MRFGAGLALTLAACTFTPPPPLGGDGGVVDGNDARPIDAPDAVMSARVQANLIGLWTFNEANGSANAEDTGGSPSVPLKVETSGSIFAPTFGAGELTATMPGRLISATNSHLAADCVTANAVTLEAWVEPTAAVEGSLGSPSFIAGIAKTVSLRDVVLLQAGDKWLGRVRTTAAQDGTPDLISTSSPSNTKMTHVVLVADATQRILYVDDVAEAIGTAGPLTGWDPSYAMALFDEPQHGRQWLGSLGLVALYDRALTAAEVHQNFALGPAAP